jgi:MFS family permease
VTRSVTSVRGTGGSLRVRRFRIRSRSAGFAWAAYVLGLSAFGAGLPTPLYPLYEKLFGFGSAVLGVVFALYTAGVFVTMFLLAPRAESIGRNPVLLVGALLSGVAAVVFMLSTGALDLGVARVVSGLSVGAITSTATAVLTALEPEHNVHRAAAVSVAANFGGMASGILTGSALVQFAPHPTVLPYAVLIGAAAVAAAVVPFLPETEPGEGAESKLTVRRISIPRDIRRPFAIATAAFVVCYTISGFFASLASSLLRDRLNVSALGLDGAFVAVLFAAAAVTAVVVQRWEDRRALEVGFGTGLVALGILVVAVPTAWLAALLTGAALLGVAVGLAFFGCVTLVDRIAPEERRDELLAGFYVGGYLALALPTVGMGVAIQLVGLVPAAVGWGLALAVFVAGALVATLRTPTPPDRTSGHREPSAAS